MVRRGISLLLIVVGAGLGLAIVDWLVGWRPRFGLEAYFQRVIDETDISDRYSREKGWSIADATNEICNRVNVAILQDLGMKDKPIWSISFNGKESRPTYVWRVMQDKGAFAACRDHSRRFLQIEIDAETSICSAKVSVLPTCDL